MSAVLPAELERQVENLVGRGWAELDDLAALADRVAELVPGPVDSRIPFVVVPARGTVPPEVAMRLVELYGKQGFTDMEAADLRRFAPIDGVEVPDREPYLLVGLDTGADTLNVTPDDALKTITADGRSPLTLAEGVALVTHFPDVLKTDNAFSLLGSRCGDRRVTAIWVSKGRPRLGWCWAGNPHTWLGSASCGGRMGA